MEFLIGRTLTNNIINLMAEPVLQQALQREGIDHRVLAEFEPDAGLGNGGLGRLAACFIDSLATRQYSAVGYGLRYEFGIFRQSLHDGHQVEQPDNWLRRPDPWEIARPGKTVQVPLAATVHMQGGRCSSFPASPVTCWGWLTIGPSSDTVATASIPCGYGPPRRRKHSSLPTSPPVISSARC